MAFTAWTATLVVVFGFGFFGLTSLALAWFQALEGVAGPVTELGYGALVGIILTVGVATQLHAPERHMAGIQQAALVVPALLAGSALAADSENVEAAVIVLVGVGILLILHPARREVVRRGATFSRPLFAITVAGAGPLVAYALEMGGQAQHLAGPPHHVQRLSTMAALAIAILLVGLLASLRTRGWRIAAWSAGVAAIDFGLGSVVYPDHPAAAGIAWGGVALAGGLVFIAEAEREARRPAPSG
ncbi:MAG: hypothetical protein ACRDGJ_03930 [Candidatus Limnocylindria bacterium]